MNVSHIKQAVLDFLYDENLAGSIKVFDTENNFQIKINDPFVDDNKQRLGIALKYFDDGKYEVVFQGFKSVGTRGDEYHGSFWKFIRLYKELENNKTAKRWFTRKYLLKELSTLEFETSIDENDSEEDITSHQLELPEGSEPLDPERHIDATNYLTQRLINYQALNIFVLQSEKRIIFPIFENKELVYYVGRSYNPRTVLPWKNAEVKEHASIWNLENVNGDVVAVFEAIFDAATLPYGIALLSSNNIGKAYYEKILAKNYSKIILIFDNDVPGCNAKYKLADTLSRYMNEVYIYDYTGISAKDMNQMVVEHIPIELNERIYKWNLQTKIKVKMGILK